MGMLLSGRLLKLRVKLVASCVAAPAGHRNVIGAVRKSFTDQLCQSSNFHATGSHLTASLLISLGHFSGSEVLPRMGTEFFDREMCRPSRVFMAVRRNIGLKVK